MNEQQECEDGVFGSQDIADALGGRGPLTAERPGSDESGEGLSEALCIGGECDALSYTHHSRDCREHVALVQRILATARREVEEVTAAYEAMFRQFEAMRADRDALRARLGAVEAFAAAHDNENWRGWGIPQGIRAALATPSAAQGEGEA